MTPKSAPVLARPSSSSSALSDLSPWLGEPRWADLRHFLMAGVVWAVLGSGTLAAANPTAPTVAAGFLLVWALCMADLAATAGTVRAVFSVVASKQGSPGRGLGALDGVLWFTAKLFALGLLGAALWKGSSAGWLPQRALVGGVSTLLIVPLTGALGWRRAYLVKESAHARRA